MRACCARRQGVPAMYPLPDEAWAPPPQLRPCRTCMHCNAQVAAIEAELEKMSPDLGAIEAYRAKAADYEQRASELDAVTKDRDEVCVTTCAGAHLCASVWVGDEAGCDCSSHCLCKRIWPELLGKDAHTRRTHTKHIYARTHKHTHTHAHTCTHAHARTHSHTCSCAGSMRACARRGSTSSWLASTSSASS